MNHSHSRNRSHKRSHGLNDGDNLSRDRRGSGLRLRLGLLVVADHADGAGDVHGTVVPVRVRDEVVGPVDGHALDDSGGPGGRGRGWGDAGQRGLDGDALDGGAGFGRERRGAVDLAVLALGDGAGGGGADVAGDLGGR